ncbi:MAG: tetratricopeptide repeat protein, partial [Muribaculaceae bacterium]|nr:tetratricopeptide repeat protein [Muribaculaceae bacterium]
MAGFRGRTLKSCISLLFLILLCAGCNAPKLSKADEAFERGEYFDAQKIYKKVYNKLSGKADRPLRGEVAFKQGLCYERLNMAANASKAFQNARRYDYPDSSIYLHLGKALQGDGQYAKAKEAYETFLTFSPGNALANEGIKGCNSALLAKNQPRSRYVVKKSPLFNSPRADYAPMYLDKNLDQLYFTTNREKATGSNHSEITGMKRGDIYVSRKDEQGRWRQPEPVEGGLNTDADEGIISFSPDGQTMYLTRARRSEISNTSVEIYTSRRSDATWSEPQKFEIIADTVSAVGHPAVSPDGTYLYFCSDMPGGFGGLDIFKAKLNSTGDFWSVENLGLPLNSKGDDFGITFGAGESGFLSSNRDDGRGRDHIYSFELPDIHITISGYVVDKDDEPV